MRRIWYYEKEDGYFYVSIYTQSDDQGNVYFSDSGGNLFSLTPDGGERFVWKANNSNMSELPFYVSRDGAVYGYSVGVGIFRIGEKGNPIKLYVNGTRLTVPVNPEIKNGNTMVPLRKIFEALGADVAWNAEQRSVTVTKNNISLVYPWIWRSAAR